MNTFNSLRSLLIADLLTRYDDDGAQTSPEAFEHLRQFIERVSAPAPAPAPAPAEYDLLGRRVRVTRGGNLVTMAKALTEATHHLTINERRLLFLALSKINSKFAAVPPVIVTAKEFSSVFHIEKAKAYSVIKQAVVGAYERSIDFYEPQIASDGTKKNDKVVRIRWLSEIQYHEKLGYVTVIFNHTLHPYISDLKNNFTSYKLATISQLKRIASCRLWDLLMRYKDTGEMFVEIDKFKRMIETPDYLIDADFAQLRRRIIQPAVDEINNAKCGYDVKWTSLKAGKKVVSLYFQFTKSSQESLDLGES